MINIVNQDLLPRWKQELTTMSQAFFLPSPTTQYRHTRCHSKKWTRDRDDTVAEQQEARKCLVSFSYSPKIHDVVSEEKGAEEVEQGTSPKPPTPQTIFTTMGEVQSFTINQKKEARGRCAVRHFLSLSSIMLTISSKLKMNSEENDAIL
jgi:hypothetical protein